MSDVKHTPDPWTVHPVPGRDYFEIHFGNAGECVAEVVHEKEDAILISAAPEMLAVLEAVEWSGYGGWYTCPSCGNRRSNGHAADCKLAAAIRKAKGDA